MLQSLSFTGLKTQKLFLECRFRPHAGPASLTSAIRQKMFTAHSLLYLVETGTRNSPKPFPQKVFWEREIVLIRTRTPPRAVM